AGGVGGDALSILGGINAIWGDQITAALSGVIAAVKDLLAKIGLSAPGPSSGPGFMDKAECCFLKFRALVFVFLILFELVERASAFKVEYHSDTVGTKIAVASNFLLCRDLLNQFAKILAYNYTVTQGLANLEKFPEG